MVAEAAAGRPHFREVEIVEGAVDRPARAERRIEVGRDLLLRLGRFLGVVEIFLAQLVALNTSTLDLAITRFSGRPAPPREGPAFMREAYSHEVISHGFWPGSGPGTLFGPGPVDEPAFYAYAVPQPPKFEQVHVEPAGAFYHRELGEFILPYRVVRTSDDPDQSLLSFIDSTYTHAADLAAWDRASLERRRAYT